VEIDLSLAKSIMKNIVKDIETEVGIDFIQKTCADYYDIKLNDLKAKTRKKEIVTARQVAMYFSKEFISHSLKSIGSLLILSGPLHPTSMLLSIFCYVSSL
jgi:chromosomal replication initiator protein